MEMKDFNGVYVVSSQIADDVVLTKFDDVLKDINPPKRMSLPGLMKLDLTGPDGIKVDFKAGMLIQVTEKKQPNYQVGFHMANVEPTNNSTAVQYAYVLSKLNLGPVKDIDKKIINVKGRFSEVIKKLAEGKKDS